MKKLLPISLALMFGVVCGASISPLFAQSGTTVVNKPTCFVGEGSNAACVGKWIYFAGNTGNLDEGVWIVRVDGDTGEIWYKDGRRLLRLEEVE